MLIHSQVLSIACTGKSCFNDKCETVNLQAICKCDRDFSTLFVFERGCINSMNKKARFLVGCRQKM